MTEARLLHRLSSSSTAVWPEASAPPDATEEISSSLAELQAVNRDVTGWVAIPGTAVDDPVLFAPEKLPDYYLTHDWRKNETKYGSIFMLRRGLPATGRKNTILYGHSMKDGRMFADLLKYESLAFYRSHPVVRFQEDGQMESWKIFAVIKVNTDPSQGQPFDYQKESFPSESAFLDYAYQVRIRSVFNLPVGLKASDDILTLSTCSYEFSGFRTVVFARRVRVSESAEVKIGEAEKNRDVLYPDCWYRRYGGEKPSPPSFQEAVESGAVPWLAK